MVIYLRHPVHGVKVACLELEAVADEANGWERFDPETPAPVADVAPPANALAPVTRIRRRAELA